MELPASLRQKLVNEAARRNVKGYSGIIVEALELYFRDSDPTRSNLAITKLRGVMGDKEYEEAVAIWKEGRRNWRT